MNTYLAELKDFVILHSKSQSMNTYAFKQLLSQINDTEGEMPGSWVYEFTQYADKLFENKKYIDAMRYYNLARFPFINSTKMKDSHQKCLHIFKKLYINNHFNYEARSIYHEGKLIKFYLQKNKKNSPVVVVIGGIISIKEQWISLSSLAKKFGYTIVLMEMPGVGENACRYDTSSHLILSKIIDSLQELVTSRDIHIIAMSFGGNLAINCALLDARIKSIFTIGAPIYNFFLDKKWWGHLPQTTKKTLAFICQCSEENLFEMVENLMITPAQLKKLNIPLYYIHSINDEIIPNTEKKYLQNHIPKLFFFEFNDVHGSPNHFNIIKMIILRFLMMYSPKKLIANKLVNLLIKFILKIYGINFELMNELAR